MPDQQYQTVSVPGEGDVQFPASMSDDDIALAIKSHLSSQPKPESSWADSVKSFLSGTLSKTAKAMNVMNTLDAIEDVGDRLKLGDWSALHDVAKMLPNMELGNTEGPAPEQTKQLQDTYQKIKSGDYSGAAANILPYVLANGIPGEAGVKAYGDVYDTPASDVVNAARQSVKNAVSKSPMVAAAKTLIPSAADVAGKALKPVLEPATAAGKAIATAVDAYKKQAASNATDAAAAAQRAAGRTPLADTVQSGPSAPEPTDSPIDIAAAQQALRERAAARQQPPAPAPSPNPVRQEAAQVRDKLASTPATTTEAPTVSPEKIAAAQQALKDKAAARKTPTVETPQPPAQPYVDPAILDSLAQQIGKPSFAKVTDAATRQKILDMGARFRPTAEVLAERARQEAAAQQPPVEPMQKFEQAADVLTNPQAGTISERIDAAMGHTGEALKAATEPVANKFPYHNPKNLPVYEIPGSKLNTAPDLDRWAVNQYRQDIRSGKPIPPVEGVALPNGNVNIVDGFHRAEAAKLEGKPVQVFLQNEKELTPVQRANLVEAKPEYYKPTGRATNGRSVPTPGDLIKSGHLEGDPLTGGPQSSSTLGHVAAENEKAFNVADYLFQNGIRRPEDFEKFPVDEAMMERARKHGAAVGNAVPQNPYRTVINDNSLRLTMAHLAKMIRDEQLRLKPEDLAKKEAADDLTEILNRSLADQKARKSSNP